MLSKSKKMIVAGIVTASIVGAGASSVMAEEEKPTAEASVAFLSQYIWRGYELSKDSLVIQPSITTSYKGFSANLWGNLDTDYYATGSHNWNETDFTLSYDGSYEKLGYGAGWIYYALEDGADDTQEFYATVSYDILLSPSLTFYYDTDDYAGDWYAKLSLAHTFMIAEKYGLDLGLSFGYTDNKDWSAFSDGLLSVSMTFPVNEYIAITPQIYWSFALSDDASNAFEGGPSHDDSFIYGGIAASLSF
jgi:hypothetical protein